MNRAYLTYGMLAASLAVSAAACVGSDAVSGQPDAGEPVAKDPSSGASAPAEGGPSIPSADAAPLPRDAAGGDAAAADAAPGPPAPPLVSPAVWLDARLIPAATTSIRTWRDATANAADATGTTALTVDRTVLAGKPGVLFVGETAQALSVAADKLAPLRTFAGAGFSVFMVVAFKDGTQPRTAQAVLFERYGGETGFNPRRFGLQVVLDSTLANVTGTLASFEGAGAQVSSIVTGVAPSKSAPHLFVLTSSGGTVAIRVDGREVRRASGFVEHNFGSNGTVPFNIGGYTSTTNAQFGLIGAVGLVAVYTRSLSEADVAAGEIATKAAWEIP